MKLSEYAILELAKLIKDLYTGPELVPIFNKWGARDIYDNLGLPDIGKRNGQRPSKTEYIYARLLGFNDTPNLQNIITDMLVGFDNIVTDVNSIIAPEHYNICNNDGNLVILGCVDKDGTEKAEVDAHFTEIQNIILQELQNARVSIIVVMAWFTNDVLARKLIEKYNDGVDVKVAIYNDGVNQRHGVDLAGIPLYKIKAQRGGIMHNKFCVIDNQVVITGSYNWSSNAEFKNDENISIIKDNNIASDYSVQFRRLLKEHLQK